MKKQLLALVTLLSLSVAFAAPPKAKHTDLLIDNPRQHLGLLLETAKVAPNNFKQYWDMLTGPNRYGNVWGSQTRLVTKLLNTAGYEEAIGNRPDLLTIQVFPNNGGDTVSVTTKKLDVDALQLYGAEVTSTISQLEFSDRNDLSKQLTYETQKLAQAAQGISPQAITTGLIQSIQDPEVKSIAFQEIQQLSSDEKIKYLDNILPDNPAANGFEGGRFQLSDKISQDKAELLNLLKTSLDAEKSIEHFVAALTIVHTSELKTSSELFNMLDNLGEKQITYLQDKSVQAEISSQIGNGDKRIQKFIQGRYKVFGSKLKNMKTEVTEKVRVNPVLTIAEVHQYIGILRGNLGGDCSTSLSFGYPNSPSERVFFIRNSRNELVGYLNGTYATGSDGKRYFYINTISGPNMNKNSILNTIKAMVSEKDALGVSEVLLLNKAKWGSNLHSTPRSAYSEAIANQTVNINFEDGKFRTVINNAVTSSGYDAQSGHKVGNKIIFSNRKLDISTASETRPYSLNESELSNTEIFLILFEAGLKQADLEGMNLPFGIKLSDFRTMLTNKDRKPFEQFKSDIMSYLELHNIDGNKVLPFFAEEMFVAEMLSPEALSQQKISQTIQTITTYNDKTSATWNKLFLALYEDIKDQPEFQQYVVDIVKSNHPDVNVLVKLALADKIQLEMITPLLQDWLDAMYKISTNVSGDQNHEVNDNLYSLSLASLKMTSENKKKSLVIYLTNRHKSNLLLEKALLDALPNDPDVNLAVALHTKSRANQYTAIANLNGKRTVTQLKNTMLNNKKESVGKYQKSVQSFLKELGSEDIQASMGYLAPILTKGYSESPNLFSTKLADGVIAYFTHQYFESADTTLIKLIERDKKGLIYESDYFNRYIESMSKQGRIDLKNAAILTSSTNKTSESLSKAAAQVINDSNDNLARMTKKNVQLLAGLTGQLQAGHIETQKLLRLLYKLRSFQGNVPAEIFDVIETLKRHKLLKDPYVRTHLYGILASVESQRAKPYQTLKDLSHIQRAIDDLYHFEVSDKLSVETIEDYILNCEASPDRSQCIQKVFSSMHNSQYDRIKELARKVFSRTLVKEMIFDKKQTSDELVETLVGIEISADSTGLIRLINIIKQNPLKTQQGIEQFIQVSENYYKAHKDLVPSPDIQIELTNKLLELSFVRSSPDNVKRILKAFTKDGSIYFSPQFMNAKKNNDFGDFVKTTLAYADTEDEYFALLHAFVRLSFTRHNQYGGAKRSIEMIQNTLKKEHVKSPEEFALFLESLEKALVQSLQIPMLIVNAYSYKGTDIVGAYVEVFAKEGLYPRDYLSKLMGSEHGLGDTIKKSSLISFMNGMNSGLSQIQDPNSSLYTFTVAQQYVRDIFFYKDFLSKLADKVFNALKPLSGDDQYKLINQVLRRKLSSDFLLDFVNLLDKDSLRISKVQHERIMSKILAQPEIRWQKDYNAAMSALLKPTEFSKDLQDKFSAGVLAAQDSEQMLKLIRKIKNSNYGAVRWHLNFYVSEFLKKIPKELMAATVAEELFALVAQIDRDSLRKSIPMKQLIQNKILEIQDPKALTKVLRALINGPGASVVSDETYRHALRTIVFSLPKNQQDKALQNLLWTNHLGKLMLSKNYDTKNFRALVDYMYNNSLVDSMASFIMRFSNGLDGNKFRPSISKEDQKYLLYVALMMNNEKIDKAIASNGEAYRSSGYWGRNQRNYGHGASLIFRVMGSENARLKLLEATHSDNNFEQRMEIVRKKLYPRKRNVDSPSTKSQCEAFFKVME